MKKWKRKKTWTTLALGALFSLLLFAKSQPVLAAPQQVQYAIQFWAEKADYDEGHVQDIGDKYEYLGVKTATGNEGAVPDYLATSTSGIQFPDVDLDVSSDAQKDVFNKLFHINSDYSKEQNADKEGNPRPLTAHPTKPRENVYNVFYDREVYEVIFEKGKRSVRVYDPIITKNGKTYDATKNPYTLTMRFGQSFGDAWPYDEDIAGFTPKGDSNTQGLTGWQVPIDPSNSIYRDTPPYRLTYDDFIQYAGKLKESRSRPGVTYNDHQIVMGTTAGASVHPVHVDFFLEQLKPTNKPNEPIAHAASVDDYVIDPSLYYWKQDTFNISYRFPMPELRGFVAKGMADKDGRPTQKQKQVKIKSQTELDALQANRGDAEPLKFIDELYGLPRETNGYLKLHYQRKTYELFISEDPHIPKTDQKFRDEGKAYQVPYDYPLAQVAYFPDNNYIPPKPTTLTPPEDFVFRGWALDPKGVAFIKDLNPNTNEFTTYSTMTMPDHNATVYAIWDTPRLITYNLEGGEVSGATDPVEIKEFDGKSLDTLTPTRTGYVFLSWKLADTDKTFDAGDTFKVDGDMTFDASWNKNPELAAQNTEIWQGDSAFDLKSMITQAEDEEDGDLKADVTITDDGGFDASKLGNYTITFKVIDKQTGVVVTASAKVTVKEKPDPSVTPSPSPTPEPEKPSITIIDGPARQDTAVKVSKDYFSDADRLLIVQDLAYADSMSAMNVSRGRYPILYVGQDTLYKVTRDEILRTPRKEIIVVGGESTISKRLFEEIQSLNHGKVTRMDGLDRFGTNKKSLDYFGPTKKAVLASGMLYADALSSAPYAQQEGAPILLVRKEAIPKEIAEVLKEKIEEAILVGGPSTLSPQVKAEAEALVGQRMERISGPDRYVVSTEVAKRIRKPDRAILTSGELWADALTAGPLAQKYRAPILLAKKSEIPVSVVDYLQGISSWKEVFLVGGPNSISKDLYNSLKAILKAK